MTLIRLELDPATDTETHLERIELASKRAAGLVQKMTAFGRRSPTVFEDIRLTAVIEDALNLVRPSVPRGIAFELRNNALSDLVHADAGQLQQAIVNLATNASHAMADGTGTLTVELSTVLLPDESRPETHNLPAGPFLALWYAMMDVAFHPQDCPGSSSLSTPPSRLAPGQDWAWRSSTGLWGIIEARSELPARSVAARAFSFTCRMSIAPPLYLTNL